MPLLLQAASRAPLPGGYGVALVQTLLALVAVCILAWVVLRWSAQRGLGIGQGQRIRVVERVVLDVKRTAFLVEVGGRYYFLVAGDAGPPALVATLDPSEVPEPERKRTFLEILRAAPPATTEPAAASAVATAPPPDAAVAAAAAEIDDAKERRDEEGAA